MQGIQQESVRLIAPIEALCFARTRLRRSAACVRLTVARFASLFDRFGIDQPHTTETRFIATMISQFHPCIGYGDVLSACHELRRIRVLQGKRTVYFAPKLLQIHLWKQWWNIYGADFRIKDLEEYPESLRSWFILTLESMPDVELVSDLANRLLQHDGWFYYWSGHKEFWGARLFRVLAELAPSLAIGCIERVLRFQELDDLQRRIRSQNSGLATIVCVLEYASMWRGTALRAIRMLQKVALAETEKEHTQATNAFCSFFVLETVSDAITELAPAERFVILAEMLLSNNASQVCLALKACGESLAGRQNSRGVWRSRGDRTRPEFWVPEDSAQLNKAKLQVWDRMCQFASDCENDDLRAEAMNVLGRCLWSVVHREEFVVHGIQSIRKIATDCPIELLRPILEKVVNIWKRVKKISPESQSQLKELYESIVYQSFETRLKRFVGMRFHFEDRPSPNDVNEPLSNVAEEIRNLARDACESPELLRPNLDWLITSAERSWDFGNELGDADKETKWWEEIVRVHQVLVTEGKAIFLAGYLVAISKRSQTEFEERLCEIAKLPELAQLVPQLVGCMEFSERSTELITELLDTGELSPEKLDALQYSPTLKETPESVFAQWMDHLRHSDNAVCLGLSLEFLYERYKHHSVVPFAAEVVANILAAPAIIEMVTSNEGHHQHHDSTWSELLELLTEREPLLAVNVLAAFFESFLNESHFWRTAAKRTVDPAVWNVIKAKPDESWAHFYQVLHNVDDKVASAMIQWLGSKYHEVEGTKLGLWPSISEKPLWQWIDQDIAMRAQFVGANVPPIVTEHGPTSITCEFLRRYYDQCPVICEALLGAEASGPIEGSWVAYNIRRLDYTRAALVNESDSQLQIWLHRHIEALTTEIERSSYSEEDTDRGRRGT